MHIFYCPHHDDGIAIFPEEEAIHCAQVLRHKTGDKVSWIDGQGGRFEGVILEITKKRCVVSIATTVWETRPRAWQLHLAMAPTKLMDRTEWMLEKAVEVGLDVFTPLWCERSERKTIREDRLAKIAIAAMKQSKQTYLPRIDPAMSFQAWITQQRQPDTQLFIAHCMDDAAKTLLSMNCTPAKNVCLLIGPEGDFSAKEINLAQENGFRAVSLGSSRLRTETAALTACLTVHIINQQP
jgi:16S rRNA (uracil1498-N3)-methyltransferase